MNEPGSELGPISNADEQMHLDIDDMVSVESLPDEQEGASSNAEP